MKESLLLDTFSFSFGLSFVEIKIITFSTQTDEHDLVEEKNIDYV